MSALLALAAGVPLGFLLRGRARAQLVVGASAPVLSALALVTQFLPGGAESCTATAGVSTCESLPAASGWSMAGYVFAALMIVLSFAPLISVRIRNWIPSAVSALLQLIPQAIHFGFRYWAPALAVAVAIAFAQPGRVRPATATMSGRAGPP
jgi:hypothetical protein